MTLSKKLVLITVAASQPDVVAKFYETFFGLTFAEALTDQQVTYHAPIDENGIDITIGPKHNAQETVIAYYAVEDINSAITQATAAGGHVLWGPAQLPIAAAERDEYKTIVKQFYPQAAQDAQDWNNLGQGALIADPAGNAVGLVQLEDHAAAHFNAGKFQREMPALRVNVHQASVALGLKHKARRGGTNVP
jgi:predicted enzyme related to lactoylglutathione lyase